MVSFTTCDNEEANKIGFAFLRENIGSYIKVYHDGEWTMSLYSSNKNLYNVDIHKIRDIETMKYKYIIYCQDHPRDKVRILKESTKFDGEEFADIVEYMLWW